MKSGITSTSPMNGRHGHLLSQLCPSNILVTTTATPTREKSRERNYVFLAVFQYDLVAVIKDTQCYMTSLPPWTTSQEAAKRNFNFK